VNFSILTLFPEMFEPILGSSILRRAIEKDLITVNIYNIRDFAKNKHKQVDDYPFGGGPGMVLTPQPVFDAVEYVRSKNAPWKGKCIYMSPQGKVLTQQLAFRLSREEHLLLLCGHYEGIDQRIIDTLVNEEISIGDYVLTGGELPAMVLIDCVSRLIPGVLGSRESYEKESFSDGLLEHPHYTRPQNFRGLTVPEVLLSGHHKNIERWRRQQSLLATMRKRPDMLDKATLSPEDEEFIKTLE
jgi:tRNA (guanine37-N1)-methyltransferase